MYRVNGQGSKVKSTVVISTSLKQLLMVKAKHAMFAGMEWLMLATLGMWKTVDIQNLCFNYIYFSTFRL